MWAQPADNRWHTFDNKLMQGGMVCTENWVHHMMRKMSGFREFETVFITAQTDPAHKCGLGTGPAHTHTDTTSDSVRLCFTENRQRYQRNRIAQYTPLLWLANLLKPLSILKRPSSFTRGSAKLRIQGSNCHNNTQHCSPLQTQTQPSKDSICEWGRWLSTMQQAGSHSVGKQPCLSQWAGESWNVIIHLIPTNKLN